MDGGIITVIGGNRTAITATVSPPNASYNQMTVLPGGGGDGQRDEVEVQVLLLDSAN